MVDRRRESGNLAMKDSGAKEKEVVTHGGGLQGWVNGPANAMNERDMLANEREELSVMQSESLIQTSIHDTERNRRFCSTDNSLL